MNSVLSDFAQQGIKLLSQNDPVLFALLEQEYQRQTNSLSMIASASIAAPSVLACEGTVLSNVTTEGYPGKRFHAGCRFIDEIENLAIERAKLAFKAEYANVQPHSGSTANEIIMFSLLKPGDGILGLDLDCGGHLTHGAKVSVSGQYFNAQAYGLDAQGLIDYEQVYRLALEFRPTLIICGASAYPRIIDFQRFREIADAAGAFLLADISHIAGLVVAGRHPSPIDHAHFTTTTTYKQLYGPRGGLILMGKDAHRPAPNGRGTLADMIQRAVFPTFQGTPMLGVIAAKARALAMAMTPEFTQLANMIANDAKAMAAYFSHLGYRVITGGTDNHIVMLDVSEAGLTGFIAERALEECNIIVNKNRIPNDTKKALVTSGVRLGTNSLALRGMDTPAMQQCVELIDRVLTSLDVRNDYDYAMPNAVGNSVRADVSKLCKRFPIPAYPLRAQPASFALAESQSVR